jgi:nonsense-mediated mRNA decay protein 3
MASFATSMAAPTLGSVLCCLCGLNIPPNPANMCGNCIRSQARGAALALPRDSEAESSRRMGFPRTLQVDITEGIQKQCTVLWCKECNRWLHVRAPWAPCGRA